MGGSAQPSSSGFSLTLGWTLVPSHTSQGTNVRPSWLTVGREESGKRKGLRGLAGCHLTMQMTCDSLYHLLSQGRDKVATKL